MRFDPLKLVVWILIVAWWMPVVMILNWIGVL